MALVELYRVTGKRTYLDQAQLFIDRRGRRTVRHRLFPSEYLQDHVPFREMPAVTGHAVRMMYLAAGAADVWLETGDETLAAAQSSQNVWLIITQRLPVTITVAVGAAVCWLLIGIIAGVVSGVREGSWWDQAAMLLTLGGASIPSYVLALVLQYILVVKLQWLPFPGNVGFLPDPRLWFESYLMPWIVLAAGYACLYARLTRQNVIDTMSENFMRTARAKGLPPDVVLRRYALRPALTPITTIFGMDFAGLLGGALIVETVFGLNGIGQLTEQAIASNDQPVIMGVTLLAAFFVVLGNLAVDILYTHLDPRVRITAR